MGRPRQRVVDVRERRAGAGIVDEVVPELGELVEDDVHRISASSAQLS